MVRNFRRSGQEPDLSLMSQGEDAYLVLRGVFHVSPPALGGLSIDGKLTFSNNAYLKLTTEWIMLLTPRVPKTEHSRIFHMGANHASTGRP